MHMSLALVSAFPWKKRSSNAMGRCKARERRDNIVAPEISLDLLIEILTRLPAKSLMRFKCVSKLWFSLIISRYFTNLYLKVPSPAPTSRLYMTLVDHIVCNDSLEGCHKPYESVLLSTSSSKARSFDQRLTIPGGRNMMTFHGLVLFVVCRKACIYNPATRQRVTLPAVPSRLFAQEAVRKNVLYFLGHDPVLDQYKIICTVAISSKDYESITSEHWVYVLEAGGFWKKVEFHQHHRPTSLRTGVFINGIIYYLAATSGLSRDIVVSFDVRSEEFSMIQAPPEVLSSSANDSVEFIEYVGRPTILDHTQLLEDGVIDLWILGDAGEWSKKPLALKPCQMHLLNEDIDLTVESTTRNGEIIFAPLELLSPFYILYYDPYKNDLRKVKIRGIPDHWFSKPDTNLTFYLSFMDKNESIMHLEL